MAGPLRPRSRQVGRLPMGSLNASPAAQYFAGSLPMATALGFSKTEYRQENLGGSLHMATALGFSKTEYRQENLGVGMAQTSKILRCGVRASLFVTVLVV